MSVPSSEQEAHFLAGRGFLTQASDSEDMMNFRKQPSS